MKGFGHSNSCLMMWMSPQSISQCHSPSMCVCVGVWSDLLLVRVSDKSEISKEWLLGFVTKMKDIQTLTQLPYQAAESYL